MEKEMEIKVCGLREVKNIKEVVTLPIDYIGFIFYEKSPRFVGNDAIDLSFVPSNIRRVGVFVNESEGNIAQKIKQWGLGFVQLHGNESPDFCKKIGKYAKVIKAFGVDEVFSFSAVAAYCDVVDFFLFDTKSTQYGGTGKRFDWMLIEDYQQKVPFLLSGGISLEDAQVIKNISHPQLAGVDLNSQFEIEPGLKNISKLEAFIQNLR